MHQSHFLQQVSTDDCSSNSQPSDQVLLWKWNLTIWPCLGYSWEFIDENYYKWTCKNYEPKCKCWKQISSTGFVLRENARTWAWSLLPCLRVFSILLTHCTGFAPSMFICPVHLASDTISIYSAPRTLYQGNCLLFSSMSSSYDWTC